MSTVNVDAAKARHAELMLCLEAAADVARSTDNLRLAKDLERIVEFARLLGIRLATIERQMAGVVS
jgi:hypothetical protein